VEAKVLFVEGGVHGAESITERPEIRLRAWCVTEVDDGTQHFIGYDVDCEEGRVSSAVQKFDRATRKGVTHSGRVYELLGRPGGNLDADYVWQIWKNVNRVTTELDVTSSYATNHD
jgi:hypothetical protein